MKTVICLKVQYIRKDFIWMTMMAVMMNVMVTIMMTMTMAITIPLKRSTAGRK